jgi:DNA-binding XRE family transcriptional regulator
MPTGYTAIIEEKEDLTFEEFALKCANIDTYDSRREADLSYHQQNLEDLSRKLIDISRMTHVEIEREAELKQWWLKKKYDEAMLNYEKLSARYARMRAKVEAWTPPTSKHQNLKKMMLEQISISEPNDPKSYFGPTAHLDPKEAMVDFDHEAWRLAQYEHVLSDMEYHQKTQANAQKSIEDQTCWVKQLCDSLKDHG